MTARITRRHTLHPEAAAAASVQIKRKRTDDDRFERTQRSRLNPPLHILPRTLDSAAAVLKKGNLESLAKKLRMQPWLLNAVVDKKTGDTLWHLAARGKPEAIATLLQALDDAKDTTRPFDKQNLYGELPLVGLLNDLIPATAARYRPAINALLRAGSTGHQGRPCALSTAYERCQEYVLILVDNIIKNGEVHELITRDGLTALSLAIDYGDVPAADALLKAGAKSDHLKGIAEWEEVDEPQYGSILDLLVAHHELHTTLPRPALPVSVLQKSITTNDRAYALRLSRFPQWPHIGGALRECARKTQFSEVTENLIGGLNAATLLPVLEDVIEHGHVSLVKRLLPKLPHVDTFLSSDTPLACAFKHDQKEIAVLLLGRGATGRLHPKLNTAFFAAYKHGHRDLLPKLVRNICALPELHTENAAELWAAIDYGDHRTLRKLLHEFGTERTNEYYRSGLFQKIINSNQRACLAEVLNYEAENGYYLRDLPGVLKNHPIDLALEVGRFDMVLALAKHGAQGKELESTLAVAFSKQASHVLHFMARRYAVDIRLMLLPANLQAALYAHGARLDLKQVGENTSIGLYEVLKTSHPQRQQHLVTKCRALGFKPSPELLEDLKTRQADNLVAFVPVIAELVKDNKMSAVLKIVDAIHRLEPGTPLVLFPKALHASKIQALRAACPPEETTLLATCVHYMPRKIRREMWQGLVMDHLIGAPATSTPAPKGRFTCGMCLTETFDKKIAYYCDAKIVKSHQTPAHPASYCTTCVEVLIKTSQRPGYEPKPCKCEGHLYPSDVAPWLGSGELTNLTRRTFKAALLKVPELTACHGVHCEGAALPTQEVCLLCETPVHKLTMEILVLKGCLPRDAKNSDPEIGKMRRAPCGALTTRIEGCSHMKCYCDTCKTDRKRIKDEQNRYYVAWDFDGGLIERVGDIHAPRNQQYDTLKFENIELLEQAFQILLASDYDFWNQHRNWRDILSGKVKS
jgi:hypothetical protein